MNESDLDPTGEPPSSLPDSARTQQESASGTSTRTFGHGSNRPQWIGNYRVLERIGVGGMGEVYRAEQTEPIRRTVALKVIKLGMDTKAVINRFEAERQALALMEHTNIAKVFDAGSTPQGRLYFAMEYVHGEPITSFCDRQRLTTEERLGLFIHLCEGVQHAHQKAIIHRDLKPSNVLVTVQDGMAVPKIIDFGVAKATAQKLTQKTMYTALGELIGTPDYMSPEQAEMTGVGVDTRTDVYSLGVILYELLVGSLPFEPQELRRVGFDRMTQILREQDPPRPSTKVSTLGERRDEVAKARRTMPDRLRRALRGDLDWITMRALEKNPTRRYGSAAELASDVRRHLRHEPVLAGPPSVGYRAGKFVRRHRVGVIFAAALGVLLTTFAVTMGVLRNAAEEARAEALARAEELELVTDFQASMLSNIQPEEMGQALYADLGERVRASLEAEGVPTAELEATLAAFDNTLRRINATDVALDLVDAQVLARAVRAIDSDFSDQPVVRAALLQTVAFAYIEMGLYARALPLQQAALETRRRTLGNDHPQTLLALNGLGTLLSSMGELEQSLVLLQESLERRRRVFGDDDPRTLSALNNLGGLFNKMGRLDEAVDVWQQALEGRRRVLGADHPQTLGSIHNMGILFEQMNRLEEALGFLQQAEAGFRRVLGDDHPQTLTAITNVARLQHALGRLDEAQFSYQEALERQRRLLGDAHPSTLMTLGGMGELLLDQGKPREALALLEPAEEATRQAFGGGNTAWLGTYLAALGRSLAATESLGPAQTYLDEAHTILWEAPNVTLQDRERALQGLVELQEAWRVADPGGDHDAQAAAWRAQLEELRAAMLAGAPE